MRLFQAARRNDTTEAADAYDPTVTFMCQYDPMSFSKIDGVAVRKRTITASPAVQIPARGVITIGADNYVVGHAAPDYWMGEVIRNTYVIQGADGLANLSTIAQALAGVPVVTAYAALVFSKYMPDTADNSKYPPQYQVFVAGSESVPADSLIELNGVFFLVKQSYLSTSGLRVALANELPSPVFETINFDARTYDPVTDSYSNSSSSIKIMRVKWSEHYLYLTASSDEYTRGDIQVFMLKGVTPKPSDTLPLSDGVWRVLSVQDEGSVWSCHVRRN